MVRNLWRFITRYRFPVIAGIILLGIISTLLVLQNQRERESRAQTIPLDPTTSNASPSGNVVISRSGEPFSMQNGIFPISIRLSEGQAQPVEMVPNAVATGEPLDEDQIEQILSRLPDLPEAPDEQRDFQLPGDPIPPPLTGDTIDEPFPPETADVEPAGDVESGPLEVLRFSPEGEIPVAPFISITFNQPMVLLNTVDALSAGEVPVTIEPALQGTWRWLGTRTLTFQYDSDLIDRLPKATTYRVTVPAGTQSATGGTLAETVEWTFSTPPPQAIFTYPTFEPQPRDPLFFIQFDQRIDPEAVLNTIEVTAANQTASLALVSEDEIKANEEWSDLLKNAQDGRWVAFRAQEPLPADSDVTVTIGPGTPSAEGPLVTTEAQSYSFRTYAPLKIEDHGCSWGGDRCQPLTPFFINFNNPIDSERYSESMVRIEPELPGAVINIYGNTIQIRGASQGQTNYTVYVDGSIQDIFGQPLGKDARLTFRVGPAEPMLFGPNSSFITLDPAAKKPVVSFYVINYPRLEVDIYAVQPTDWPAYKEFARTYSRTDRKVNIPGRQVLSQTLPVEAAADRLTEVNIDLSQYMDGDYGHFILFVKPPQDLLPADQSQYWYAIPVWVQITQIGLDAFSDHSEMVAWTTGLADGAPLGGVTITAQPSGWQTTTGSDGIARFAIPDGTSYLIASQGADQALLPRYSGYWSDDTWRKRTVNDQLRWYVFDDRKMYRPGEEVHVKGWLRRIGSKQDGSVELVGSELESIFYQIYDSQGNEIGSGSAEANALGGFDFAFTLPEQVNLGYTQIHLMARGSLGGLSDTEYYHDFQVQEFRRPEFEVTARNETTGPYFAGGSATVAVEANYYAGGALPNAEVSWMVTYSLGHYAPPNWPDFTFGVWTPLWGFVEPAADKMYFPGWGGNTQYETFGGVTDASGTHYLQLDFDVNNELTGKPSPVSVLAEATVIDVNRQGWTGETTLLVHPASLYVGLRSDKYFVERGTPLVVEAIVTDLDGNAIADRPVEIQAARMEWKFVSGEWQEEAVDVQTCSVGSASEPVTCTFETNVGGKYRITAVVTDKEGRQNLSEITRWVSGGEIPPARNVEQEQVTLIPDRESYQPGDVAEILVMSPFSPAEGLLTLDRSGIVTTERFHIEDGTYTLRIPIEDQYVPNLHIQVDVAGSAQRSDDQGNPLPDAPRRPAYAVGRLNLSIPPLQRTLSLQITPEQTELEPGGETVLDLTLSDADGQPVPDAELAVVVVDEAILALTGYELTSPLDVFYAERYMDLQSVYSRESIILANPLELAADQAMDGATQNIVSEEAEMEKAVGRMATGSIEAPAAAPAADMAAGEMGWGGAAAQEPIRVRTDFNPLAIFAPAVRTGADGKASVMVKLPDNLTRYRVMAVAVDDGGSRFGSGEANLTARLPLMVRPSAPRFLNFGDRFELPVVLQNQTDAPMTVDVAIRASNIELVQAGGEAASASGVRVTVSARDRVEVRFPAAAQMAGTARFQVAAVGSAASGSPADAAVVDLPVYTPATTEAFATYGVLDQGAVLQPLAAPQDVIPNYGGLEITTSSTALQALTDAVLYLVSYPYDCTEQLASRILAISALRDVLTAFDAEGLPSPQEMEDAVRRDIEMLQGLQNDDGGFPYWRRTQPSIPFNTIHTAHALARAQSKGFEVPADMQQRALAYLRQIETHYPSWYSRQTRQTLSAYALYVRDLMGDSDPAKAQNLLDDAGVEDLSLDALGWLWPVLQDSPNANAQLEAIRRHVNNRAVETAGAANFTTSYDDQNYLLLGSNRRTDAILLNALIEDNPQHDLIPKVVNGLLAHRTRGRWNSTQENVFVLLALDRYFNTFEAQTPDFVARIWLGSTYAGSASFSGRTTDRHQTDVPMAYLVDPALGGGEMQNLILSKEGDGRLYYRLGLRYAPSDLQMSPLDMGFVVRRAYEAVDNPDDVSQDAEGSWHIKAGARVRVRLTMAADNRRYHVALVDPLPAGLEAINPSLAVSGGLPVDPGSEEPRSRWWWGPWYEHQNLRDERVEVFTTLLWDGVYEYTYVARATTPGRFVVPPPKAEEMYSPEVFGRGGSDVVIVE